MHCCLMYVILDYLYYDWCQLRTEQYDLLLYSDVFDVIPSIFVVILPRVLFSAASNPGG